MIGLHGFGWRHVTFNHRAEEREQIQRAFGQLDLAAKQRHTGAGFFALMDEFEAIACGATAAAENADDQFGIIGRKLFHGAATVEWHFEEEWTISACHAGDAAQDVVVDEERHLFG